MPSGQTMSVSSSPLPQSGSTKSKRGVTLKVLLAEDSPVIQELARAMLDALGCYVEVVDNGISALEALALSDFDLVLMDCQMPDLDGWGATRALRRQERKAPRCGRIPVIALTADAEPTDKVRCLDAGMDDLLGKPFSATELSEVLERWGRGCKQQAASTPPGEQALAAEAMLPELPTLLDAAALQQLQGLPASIRVRLFEVYTRDAPALVEQIVQGTRSGDHASVVAASHRLKSSSASLGALALAALCKSMEAAAHQRHFEDFESSIGPLQQELARALAAMATLRGTLK